MRGSVREDAHVGHESRLPGGRLDLVDPPQQLPGALHAQVLEGHLGVGGRLDALGQPLVDGHQQQHHRQPAQEGQPHLACRTGPLGYLATNASHDLPQVLIAVP